MKIGFIGAGNMGKAMIKGITTSGILKPEEIIASDAFAPSLESLKTTGVQTTSDNKSVAGAPYVVLSIKPQIYEKIIREIAPVIKPETVIITIAPGWTLEKLSLTFNKAAKIIRCMPNTPAMVSAGMTALCPNEHVSADETAYVASLFSGFGKCEVIPEKLMDVAGAVSGSSPAFAYMFIEALADGAVAEGMPREQAYKFAAQAVMGSAKMVLENNIHPGQLKDMVCSPGGTTIEGVQTLEQGAFRGNLMQAVRSCVAKSRQLS